MDIDIMAIRIKMDLINLSRCIIGSGYLRMISTSTLFFIVKFVGKFTFIKSRVFNNLLNRNKIFNGKKILNTTKYAYPLNQIYQKLINNYKF